MIKSIYKNFWLLMFIFTSALFWQYASTASHFDEGREQRQATIAYKISDGVRKLRDYTMSWFEEDEETSYEGEVILGIPEIMPPLDDEVGPNQDQMNIQPPPVEDPTEPAVTEKVNVK